MSSRRNGFIESIMRLKEEQKKDDSQQEQSKSAEPLPCTFRVGSSTTDIAPQIRSAMGVCFLVYDFTEAARWPITMRMGFTRRRVETVSYGLPLFEIQAATRQLQSDLEHERKTFTAMMSALDHCVRNSLDAVTILNRFLSAFARTMGRGVAELLDGRDEGHSEFPFACLGKSLWRMDDYDKQIVDDLEQIFGEVADFEHRIGIESLNQCISWLCILGFLSSYHYSIMRRTRFITIFNTFFILARALSNKDIHRHLAGVIYASAQVEEAKQQLVLKKCVSYIEPLDAEEKAHLPFNMVPLVSFQLKIAILRLVRGYRAMNPNHQSSELSSFFGDTSHLAMEGGSQNDDEQCIDSAEKYSEMSDDETYGEDVETSDDESVQENCKMSDGWSDGDDSETSEDMTNGEDSETSDDEMDGE